MALKLYNESDIQDIADSIRAKNGTQNTYKVSQMADAIDEIPSGGGDVDKFFTQYNQLVDLSEYSLGPVTDLREYSFYMFAKLTGITFPSGLTSIGKYAFYGCSELILSSLPESVVSIGNNAFEGCSKLALTSLPSGLTSISDGIFQSCVRLALSSLPEGVTSIGRNSFQYCAGISGLTSLPSSVTSIGANAFSRSGIVSMSIPEGVTSIKNDTFYYCKLLTSVSLPSGLTSIEVEAFAYSDKIPLIDIPSAIQSIGGAAFLYCSLLKTVICRAISPPSLGGNAFAITHSELKIYVPDDSVEDYKGATNWSVYADKIYPLSQYNPS